MMENMTKKIMENLEKNKNIMVSISGKQGNGMSYSSLYLPIFIKRKFGEQKNG